MKPVAVGRTFAFVLALLGASALRAEVRLETNPSNLPQVEVISTPLGPWSPTSTVTSVVLNPDGDLSGDSQPGWSPRGQSALAAWVRPTTSTIELAIGRDDSWTPLPALSVDHAFRQPMVDPLDSVWTVTWQQEDAGGPRVYMTSSSEDGRTAVPMLVGDGVLVGTVPGGGALTVVIADPQTGNITSVLVQVTYVPTQPMPIELRPGGLISVGTATGDSLLGSCARCAELRFHDIVHYGQPVAALTWWSGTSTVEAVEISAEGPVLPVVTVSTRGALPHPQRLVQEALRALQRR